MPYTSPPTVATGTPIQSAAWGNLVKGSLDFLANPPACRLYHNAGDQNIPHVTVTAATFDSERFDTDSMHSGVNPSRITFNTAGLYIVSFSAAIAAAADYTLVMVLLRLNGITYIAKQTVGTQAVSDDHVNLTVTTPYKFTAGQYLEAAVYHRNGASATRALKGVGTGGFSPEFSAVWVGQG